MAGLGYLLRSELAARIEAAAIVLAFAWFAVLGRPIADFLGLAVIACILMSVEALNTAIEDVVDKLSPEQSVFARGAKDLGSTAVFFMTDQRAVFIAATDGGGLRPEFLLGRLLVEMIVDRLGHARRDALHRHQILDAGAAHRLGRAEMAEQGALARRADAVDLVERVRVHLLARGGRGASRWRSGAPRRAGAGRNRAPGRGAAA